MTSAQNGPALGEGSEHGACTGDSDTIPTQTPRIVMDAFGGDLAPEESVKGAVAAARRYPDIHLILTGAAESVGNELAKCGETPGNVEVIEAPERVGMDEDPVGALRKKKNSSISVGIQLIRQGKADAFVSAGNTGAVVAASSLRLRTIEGVQRPGIAILMQAIGHRVVAIDMGANMHCKPGHLLQYGVMADVFVRELLKMENPRVGLLNVGGEEAKGNTLTKHAFELLAQADLNFVGNVEGRDLFSDACDIVVCDGFVGNVLLKFSESIWTKLVDWFKAEISKSLRRKIGYLLLKDAFQSLSSSGDYAEYGGALLLGVDGVVIIAHGHSGAKAFENAVREARNFIELNINRKIADAIRQQTLD